MTEKNTLSILENIKKKMQKFDQQPKKIETISSVKDEFEYIPSSKPKSESLDANGVAAQQNSNVEIKQNNEFKISDPVFAPNSQGFKPSSSPFEDDLDLDDLSDLDSQSATQNNYSEKVAVSSEEVIKNSASSDLNKSIDQELDILDDELKKDQSTVKEKNTEIDHDDFDFDLDLNLDLDEEIDHQKDEVELAQNQNDNSLENALNSQSEKIEQTLETQNAPENNSLSDLDLDELLKEEKIENDKEIKPLSEEDNADNFDEDKFLQELGLKNENTQSQNKTTDEALSEKSEEIFEDKQEDIQEVKEVVIPQSNEVKVEQRSEKESLLDESDLDDLNNIEQNMFVGSSSVKNFEDELVKQVNLEDNQKNNLSHETDYKIENSSSAHDLKNDEILQKASQILETKINSWLEENLQIMVEKAVQEEVRKLFEKK